MSGEVRILILEDRPADAELVMRELRQAGIQFVGKLVASEADYLAQLRDDPPNLILADYSLPAYDGLAALAAAQEERPETPFIFVSGTMGEETAIEALHHGATDYVLKPRLTRLGPAVRRALDEVEEHAQRQRAEEALRATERSYQEIFNATNDAIFLHDAATGAIVDVNQTALDMFGYSREELQKLPGDQFCAGAAFSHKEAVGRIQQASVEGPHVFEWQSKRRNGELFWTEVALRGASIGGQGRVLAVVRDITERKRVEERLRKLAAAVDQSPVSIVITDRAGNIEFVNPKFAQMTGYLPEEVAGKNPRLLKSGETSAETYRQLWETITAGNEWRGEFHNKRKDGSLYWESASISPIRDAAGEITHFIAVKEDITEKKRLEVQFLRAQRLEGVGALASGIAHDLNNILAPVLMIASLLRATATDADSRSMLDTIEKSAQRGADIIKQLLTFARGQPGARVPLPVRHLLRDMEKIIRETFPRDITPRVDTAKDLWPLLGDATQLHQALLNLCVNARDAMPDGGTVTVGAKNVSVDEAFASMTLDSRPGAFVCVSVTDTGKGIAPENLDRIFDPFFTTKEIGKGTGLGLATVLGIVRGHEGFLRVESSVGHGTAFELYFPAAPEAQAPAAPGREAPPPRGQGELILVVDDETTVQNSVRRTLERHGYRVVTAPQGAAGLEVFSQHRAEIRAVLTDMMMPVMNGPAMIAALRRIEPRLVILGMTGLAERTGVKGLDNLELSVLLTKPFTGAELLRVLHAALQPSGAPAPPKGVE